MAWVAAQGEIESALRDHPAVVAGVEEVAQALRAVAMGLARVRAFATGEYASMIFVRHESGASFVVVATSDHAWFVEMGTGIHGPKHAIIEAAATTASGRFKFFVMDRGAPRKVIIERHKGSPARHVMQDAAQQIAGLAGVEWHPNPI